MKKPVDLPYPNILAVDTTNRDSVSLAWLEQGQAPRIETFPVRSQELPRLIDEFLVAQRQTIKSIKALAVMRVPGSLTGARMGIATVNTLAWLHSLPIITLDQADFSDAINDLSRGRVETVGWQVKPSA